jgi:hypothetical protein
VGGEWSQLITLPPATTPLPSIRSPPGEGLSGRYLGENGSLARESAGRTLCKVGTYLPTPGTCLSRFAALGALVWLTQSGTECSIAVAEQ